MTKFDEAIQESLNAGQDYLTALEDLDDLVRELDDALRKATGGAVVTERQFVGSTQDQRRRALIIARGGGGTDRTLWEVAFSPDGYPVKVIAPDESLFLCATRDDLEQAFLRLLRQGATGRQIKVLQEASTKQAS